MNVKFLQYAPARLDEAVRSPCFYNNDVPGGHFTNHISDHETRASFLHYDDLVVLVQMQRRSSSRLCPDHEHRNRYISLFRPDKVVRTSDKWQIFFSNDGICARFFSIFFEHSPRTFQCNRELANSATNLPFVERGKSKLQSLWHDSALAVAVYRGYLNTPLCCCSGCRFGVDAT